LHQAGVDNFIATTPDAYAGIAGCPGIVTSSVTVLSSDGPWSPTPESGLGGVSLAVDVAVSSDGELMALAVPGNSLLSTSPSVVVGRAVDVMTPHACSFPGMTMQNPPKGEVVAVSFLGSS